MIFNHGRRCGKVRQERNLKAEKLMQVGNVWLRCGLQKSKQQPANTIGLGNLKKCIRGGKDATCPRSSSSLCDATNCHAVKITCTLVSRPVGVTRTIVIGTGEARLAALA